METDTILVIAGVGIGIYVLNKSGFFDAAKSVTGAATMVGDGAQSILRETNNVVDRVWNNPLNVLGPNLGNFGTPTPGYYAGSPSGTARISPEQFSQVLANSGVSTMTQVQSDIQNVGGTYVSPLFNGGSYTPTNPIASQPSRSSPTTFASGRAPTYSSVGKVVPKTQSIAFKKGLIK